MFFRRVEATKQYFIHVIKRSFAIFIIFLILLDDPTRNLCSTKSFCWLWPRCFYSAASVEPYVFAGGGKRGRRDRWKLRGSGRSLEL